MGGDAFADNLNDFLFKKVPSSRHHCPSSIISSSGVVACMLGEHALDAATGCAPPATFRRRRRRRRQSDYLDHGHRRCRRRRRRRRRGQPQGVVPASPVSESWITGLRATWLSNRAAARFHGAIGSFFQSTRIGPFSRHISRIQTETLTPSEREIVGVKTYIHNERTREREREGEGEGEEEEGREGGRERERERERE